MMDAPEHKTDWPAGEDDTPDASRRRIGEPRNDPGRAARWAAWQAENAGAIEASNRWYEKHGHPLADYMARLDGAV